MNVRLRYTGGWAYEPRYGNLTASHQQVEPFEIDTFYPDGSEPDEGDRIFADGSDPDMPEGTYMVHGKREFTQTLKGPTQMNVTIYPILKDNYR